MRKAPSGWWEPPAAPSGRATGCCTPPRCGRWTPPLAPAWWSLLATGTRRRWRWQISCPPASPWRATWGPSGRRRVPTGSPGGQDPPRHGSCPRAGGGRAARASRRPAPPGPPSWCLRRGPQPHCARTRRRRRRKPWLRC